MAEGRWQVRRDGRLVGEIDVEGGKFPWLQGTWIPYEGFDELRHLFDRERELVQAQDLDVDAWEAAWRLILDAGVSLHKPTGEQVAEFLLHVDGDVARFRWMDERFNPAGAPWGGPDLPGNVTFTTAAVGGGPLGAFLLALLTWIKRRLRRTELDQHDD